MRHASVLLRGNASTRHGGELDRTYEVAELVLQSTLIDDGRSKFVAAGLLIGRYHEEDADFSLNIAISFSQSAYSP